MNHKAHYSLLIFSTLFSWQTKPAISLQNIKNYLLSPFSKQVEEVTQQEYVLRPGMLVTLEPRDGNVTVSGGCEGNTMKIKAVKKAATKDIIKNLRIAATPIEGETKQRNELVVRSEHLENAKGSIDYTVQLPSSCWLVVKGNHGNVHLENMERPALIQESNGEVCVKNCKKNAFIISSIGDGSFTATNVFNPVHVSVGRGSINIMNNTNNVHAYAQRGRISIFNSVLPDNGCMSLKTCSGSIELRLDPNTNADIRAYAKSGTVTSEVPIKIRERKTTLDTRAWREFRKQVDGTLGEGGPTFELRANQGNIKITKAIAS